jgi:hypothetical protein
MLLGPYVLVQQQTHPPKILAAAITPSSYSYDIDHSSFSAASQIAK